MYLVLSGKELFEFPTKPFCIISNYESRKTHQNLDSEKSKWRPNYEGDAKGAAKQQHILPKNTEKHLFITYNKILNSF